MNWQPLLASRLEIDDSRPEYWLSFSIVLCALAWWCISHGWTRASNLKSSVGRKTGQGAVGFGAVLLVVPTALVGLLFALLLIVQWGVLLILAAPFWLIARLLQPVPRRLPSASPGTSTSAPPVSTLRSGLENALPDLTEAIRLNPNDAEAFGLRGEAYQKLGRRNEAFHDRMRAMELNRRRRYLLG